jgi:hypothetical protein
MRLLSLAALGSDTILPNRDTIHTPVAYHALSRGERDWPYIAFVRSWETLPGGELIRTGLSALDHGVVSVSALVSVGAPRLRLLGLEVPRAEANPEHRLYALLQADSGDGAHSQYNALIGRLVSFERALACVN